MDRDNWCECLITWLQTFKVDGAQTTAEDLSDGVAMSHALHQIAPNFFNDAWLSKIKSDVSSNWRLKVSNLKKVLKGILDYYADVLGQQIQDFQMPDVNAVGEKHSKGELGRLIQLILGCAVNCDDKQEYIKTIMAMEEDVQHVVMNAIQELMTKESPASAEGSSELSEQLKRTLEELNNVVEQKDSFAQRCHELDLQVSALQEERTSVLAENERLNDRLHQADSLEDPSTPAGRRHQQLQAQVEQLQDELFRMEGARDDLRIKAELQEKEILDLQQKNEDLSKLAEEARSLKDELDILRHTEGKVAKYEATIESYKKKLEELSDLKGQVKLLEEKNTAYMQTNMDLQEDIRKSGAVKSQLELYKRQVQEIQMKITEETKRGDKAEFEAKRIQEKMSALQREKERLIAERDSLKETNEELRCTQVQKDSLLGDADPLLSDGSVDMVAVPPQIKEQLIRLQHENKMLRIQRAATEDEQGQLLQTQLDDTNLHKNELESELRIANQRILELEAQLEDLTDSQQTTSPAPETSELRRRLTEESQRGAQLEAELNRRKTQLSELEPQMASQSQQLQQLKDLLTRKDDEMRQMEDRYKRYLDKAKNVIQALDANKANMGTDIEATTLRNQLQEKDRFIHQLEKDQEKSRNIREQEEKLIVTAWYNLGIQLHRKAADDRLTSSGAGQSFLARQRQAHTRRSPAVNSPHSLTANAR